MYNIKKAAERLSWRFRKDKTGNYINFKPNNSDVDALKMFFGWIDRQKKETLLNNQLFAKLYIYFLNQQIRYYNTDAIDNINQKELSKLLDLPLENYYEAFHKELHSARIMNIVDRVNKEDGGKFNPKELESIYTLEFVTMHLDNQITEALNRFS